MASGASPASSPRLPSPPPIAEDQIGPTSPGVSLFEEHGKFPGVNSIDNGASRRIRVGRKAEDMAEGPPLVELQDVRPSAHQDLECSNSKRQIDSAFQLTEHLKALHYTKTHPPDSDAFQPITADIAKELCTPPANTSKDIWLYELGRFLIQKTNAIIVALFADNPPCSSQTCPEMRASEWQYLCAVHDPPKSCAAIDYCCHTLDWAATTLTSSKMFPSRLGLGSGSGSGLGSDKVLAQQMKEIKNIFRRVYRIYAHAWFQHREMFWRVEGKTGLYVLFKMVCDEYGIIESENYTIPAEAEGVEPEPQTAMAQEPPSLLRRGDVQDAGESTGQQDVAGNNVLAMGDTTKRHRHTMSDLSSSASNIIEEEVEEEEEQTEDKPSLDRQDTALKDMEEQAGEDATQEEEEPVPGIARSDTMKPLKTEDEDEGDEDVGEATVVEDTTELKTPVDASQEPKVEVTEVKE